MKKIILIIIASIFLLPNVYANDIKSIYMDIFIDSNGNAQVKETWNAELTSGTEGYKPYYNLGDSEITNYKVTLNNSEEYASLNSWNVNSSFSEKSYKSGLNYIDDGIELCFGISKYGSNSYTMSYTITNFVKATKDYDMVYFNLIPSNLSDKPEYTYIKIYSDYEFSDSLDVWGYGNYGGLAYVSDGYIEMVHEDSLDSDEYMTILVKFPKGTYNTISTLNKNFDYYYKMAQDGAESYYKDREVLGKMFAVLLWIVIIASIYFASKKKINFGKLKIKISKDITDYPKKDYFRDLPFGSDLNKAYWVAGNFQLVKSKNDYLGAILLKWLKNDNIKNEIVISKILKKEQKALKLLKSNNLGNHEKKLFDMMMEASVDGILEKDEFTNWCKKNYKKILEWFDDVIDDATISLTNDGLLTKVNNQYKTNIQIKDYAYKMTSLKNFLNDFSNIKDRESIEVKIWDEYLMYAQIFGIAKKVAKEFKDMYPNIVNDDYYDDILFIQMISYNGITAASSEKAKAESYNAGGGGFSSGGGGSGSFGGGSGGGGFR